MRIYDCPTCGQASIDDAREDERHLMIDCHGECPDCRAARYGGEETHEQPRLFAPAPAQLAGQLGFNAGTSTEPWSRGSCGYEG